MQIEIRNVTVEHSAGFLLSILQPREAAPQHLRPRQPRQAQKVRRRRTHIQARVTTKEVTVLMVFWDCL